MTVIRIVEYRNVLPPRRPTTLPLEPDHRTQKENRVPRGGWSYAALQENAGSLFGAEALMDNNGVASWLRRRRAKSGSKPALVSPDQTLSYTELADRANRLAHALKDRDVAKGDRVAYLGDNHPSFVETFFACELLGAIFVPLNTRLAAPELQYQLQDSGARLLITAEDLEAVAVSAVDDTAVSHRLGVAADIETVSTTAPLPSDFDHYSAVLESATPVPIDEHVSLDDGAVILYTSGPTGQPKGALLTHGNITWNCFNTVVDMI